MNRPATLFVILATVAATIGSAPNGRAWASEEEPEARRARLSEILGTPDAGADTPTNAPANGTAAGSRAALPPDWVPRPWDGGSISVGTTDEGYLIQPRALPFEGDGWRVLSAVPERGTYYATDELVDAIREAGRAVARRHPTEDGRPRLVVGNLSLDVGGPITFSQSHRAGRDVDLLFFASEVPPQEPATAGAGATPAPTPAAGDDADDDESPTPPWDDAPPGRAFEVDDFVYYGCDGLSEDGRLRFDDARNWAVVESFLTNRTIEVQFIFVSRCLRRRLLAYAEGHGADAALLERARQVLWRPSDSRSHGDHFHIRLYCSVDDLAAGCEDGGRYWDWVPTHPERRLEAARQLEKDLRSRDAGRRLRAVQAMVSEWHENIAWRLGRLVDDADEAVRRAAADALALFDPEACYGQIVALLKTPTDLERFRRGLEALVRLGSDGSAWRLEQILKGSYAPLEELKPGAATRAELRTLAARGLGRIGRYRSLPPLVSALDDPHEPLRRMARQSLRRLTNQRAADDDADVPAVATAWNTWWEKHRSEKEARWHRDGFRKAGFDVPFKSWTWEAVPALVDAVAAPAEIGWTAHRLLERIGKGTSPPWHPDPVVRAARWRAWWWGGHPRLARRTGGES